jgi:hypothetical protein
MIEGWLHLREALTASEQGFNIATAVDMGNPGVWVNDLKTMENGYA